MNDLEDDVRDCGGRDPFVLLRGREEMDSLQQKRVQMKVIPDFIFFSSSCEYGVVIIDFRLKLVPLS
nr:hypothetical protein [Tanacetum cinerariifolium]GEZ50579.1 hypothetical protein [Tanacetum cinerariifolium]